MRDFDLGFRFGKVIEIRNRDVWASCYNFGSRDFETFAPRKRKPQTKPYVPPIYALYIPLKGGPIDAQTRLL